MRHGVGAARVGPTIRYECQEGGVICSRERYRLTGEMEQYTAHGNGMPLVSADLVNAS